MIEDTIFAMRAGRRGWTEENLQLHVIEGGKHSPFDATPAKASCDKTRIAVEAIANFVCCRS